MGKNKMIAKSCPKCEMQVAVASKSCKCGHTFFLARRGADAAARAGGGVTSGGVTSGGVTSAGVTSPGERRRTARVTRPQPQFYDSQHYQKQKRRSPKKRSLSGADEYRVKGDKPLPAGAGGVRPRRRRALRRAPRSPPRGGAAGGAGGAAAGGGGGAEPALGAGQAARCRLILQEINRRVAAVTWAPAPRV